MFSRSAYPLITLLTILFALQAAPVFAQTNDDADEPNLLELAESFCLDPDGDHELTWALAAHRGYRPLTGEDFPGLRTPGARRLRGFTKRFGTTDIRIMTAVNRYAHRPREIGAAVNLHLCWVSANPATRGPIDNELRDYMGVRRYRQGGAFAYAYTQEADGKRKGVRRSDFNSRFIETARDHDMRVVMSNEALGWVSITYWRPVESCEDWCY